MAKWLRLSFLIRKIEGSNPSIPENKSYKARYLAKKLFYRDFPVEIY